MKFHHALVAAAALLAAVGAANATTIVVNLDATKGSGPDGMEVDTATKTVSLAAGTYTLSVIDNVANGGYNGYNFNTGTTIREAFDVSINGGAVVSIDVGSTKFASFATSADALNAFASGPFSVFAASGSSYDATRVGSLPNLTFTLDSASTVTFGIPDNRFGDNKGGVSLAITAAVPEPETYALMLGGLGALGFVARRRKPV